MEEEDTGTPAGTGGIGGDTEETGIEEEIGTERAGNLNKINIIICFSILGIFV